MKKIVYLLVGVVIFLVVAGFITKTIFQNIVEHITDSEVQRITNEQTRSITQQEIVSLEKDITQTKGLGRLCSSLTDCFVFCKSNLGRCNDFCNKNPTHELCALPEAAKYQEWVKDGITQPLPEGASKVRLQLPAPLDDISLTGIGAYGAHPVGHAEGLDHEWIPIDKTIQVRSWADGEVVYARLNYENSPNKEYRIIIYYGDGLWGEHMHVRQPLVKEGQKVKAGDPVAYGEIFSSDPDHQSAEFNVADQHRGDGVGYWYKFVKGATLVSPFDYLRDDVKQQLVEKWQKEIIEKYLLKGEEVGGVVATPWEPYLTNPILFHQEHKGTLIGEWFLRSKPWTFDNVPEILIFFTNNTQYYHKERVWGVEEGGIEDTKPVLSGDWNADYQNNRIIITTRDTTYYGIFELDESVPQAQLKIEYRQDSYPTGFSEQAAVYTERERISKGEETHYWKYPEDDPKNW